jgi:hypothetical protein
VSGLSLRKALAVAALLAVVVAFAVEGVPHRHSGGLDGRGCPACQASRQHVSDAPRDAQALLTPPGPATPRILEPAVERKAASTPVSGTSPRSPPSISA